MKQMGRKQIFFAVMLAVQLLCVGIGIAGCIGGERVLMKLDAEEVPTGEKKIALNRGSYLVELDYETSADAVRSTPMILTSHELDTAETVFLLKDNSPKQFELLLTENTKEFYMELPDAESGADLTIKSMTIKQTRQMNRMVTFCLAFFFLVVDCLFLAFIKLRGKVTTEKKGIAVCLVLMSIFVSVPLFVNYLTSGHDLTFHLMRIEGLATGLLEGQFPVKMQPVWLNDYGYPVSVMYGDLLLYLPAVLRLIGFPLQTTFKIYIYFIQVITILIAYFCTKKVSGNDKMGVVGSFLYVFATNRMTNIYYRSAVGEYTAYAFFPLVFLGLWYLLGKEKEEKNDRKRAFFFLVTGYTGILESHLLSFQIMIVFTILYCLLSWKRFLKQFVFLVKTALVTIVLNLGFLIPMLDYMASHDMKVEFASAYNMQEQGIFISQLFQMFCFPVSASGSVMSGVGGDMAVGIGMSFALILALFLWEVVTFYQRKKKGTCAFFGKEPCKIFVMLLLAVLMSCYFFPWNAISNIPVVGKMLTPYQFAWRFIGIATMLGVMLAMYVINYLDVVADKSIKVAVISVLCVITLIGSEYLMDNKLAQTDFLKITSAASLDTRSSVANGEYLFVETAPVYMNQSKALAEDGTAVFVEQYEKKKGVITMTCKNPSAEAGKVKVPLLNYKGYAVLDAKTKEPLAVSEDDFHIMEVVLPAGYDGQVKIYFRQPWYWRVAEGMSFVTAAILIVWAQKGKKKKERLAF